MKDEAILKINKVGKISHIIAVIVKVALSIGFVCAILGMIAVLCLPDDLITVGVQGNAVVKVDLTDVGLGVIVGDIDDALEDIREGSDSEFNINGVYYKVDSAEMKDSVIDIKASAGIIEFTLKDLWWVILMAALIMGMSIVLVIFIDKLCVAVMNCTTPFEDTVIKKLQNFAYALIPWSIVSSFAAGITSSFFSGKVNVFIGMDLGMVTLVLIVLFISYVFKYGAMLQKESDETL